jgi:prepilin-type N-terminal cleavage/methylation domain-containing protein
VQRVNGRAFTLVELVIVIVILAIVAGTVAPRLLSSKSRQGEQLVRGVAELLSAAAKRDTYSTQRTAVDFDAAAGKMKLVTLRVSNPASFDPGGEVWVDDPLAPAVNMEGLRLTSGLAGVTDLDVRKFRVEFPGAGGAEPRPGVGLLLVDDGGQKWYVRLSSSSTRAEISSGNNVKLVPVVDPDVVDLDATGGRDDAW